MQQPGVGVILAARLVPAVGVRLAAGRDAGRRRRLAQRPRRRDKPADGRLHLRRLDDDFGYNQAAYEGAQALKKACPNLKILEAENVPETAEADARHGAR